jgi:hypothetical protein
MKSEHRHELAENDLGKIIARWRDQLEPHANKILIGFLVVAVLVVGAIVALRSTTASSSAGVTELSQAEAAEDFETVADDFEGTTAGTWARLRAGEEYLRDGIRLSLSDRAASNERLEEAQQSFDKVLKLTEAPPEVREKALFGLASCLEAMSSEQTTTQPAIEAYEQLIEEFPDTRYKRWAEERMETLKSSDAQEFYAWFHKQTPKPEDRPLPRDFPDPFSSFPDEGTSDASPIGELPPPPPSSQRNSTAPTPPGETPATEGPALPDADGPTIPEGSTGEESPASSDGSARGPESTTPEPETTTPQPDSGESATSPQSP